MDNSFKMQEFDKAILNGTAAWWKMDLPSGNVFFGEAKAKMLGFPDSMFKTYKDFVNLVHPDDVEKTMQSMRDHISGKEKLYETVYRIKNKDGEYIRFYDCGQVIRRDGDNLTIIGFVLKVFDDVDVLEQMNSFKQLIIAGNPSIIDLVSQKLK